MKTLKDVQCQKLVIWSLVVMFSFLQTVPTGWAATRPVPVDELQGQGVSQSVDALANSPVTPKPAPMSQRVMVFVDSTSFQLNDNPLSPATKSDAPAPATVTNPIERVIVGPSPRTNPIERVIVGPTIEPIHIGPSPVTNPIEKVVIGPTIEPIHIGPSPRTNPIEKVVIGPTIEPVHIGPTIEPVVIGPTIEPVHIGPTIEPVVIGPTIEPVVIGPTIEPVVIGPTIEPIHIGPSPVIPPAVQANVDALKKALGKDFSVNAILQADGTYLVTAKWLVEVCDENGLCATRSGRSGLTEMKCNLSWDGILNKDSLRMTFWFDETGQVFHPKEELLFNGMALLMESLSDMETLAFLANNVVVTKVAADGAVQIRIGRGNNFKIYRDEEGVLQVEQFAQLPPAVQAYADKLKSTLGAGYDVTAMLRSDGTYIVRVEKSKACAGTKDVGCTQASGAPETFRSLKFILDKNGSVNRDSVRAYYNGVEVDGKLLFDAMGALEASFHPEGSQWMPPASTYIARLVELAIQIRAKKSGENLFLFEHNGRFYKASRDANGNVKLDEAVPTPIGRSIEKTKVGSVASGVLKTQSVSSRKVSAKESALLDKVLAKAKR